MERILLEEAHGVSKLGMLMFPHKYAIDFIRKHRI